MRKLLLILTVLILIIVVLFVLKQPTKKEICEKVDVENLGGNEHVLPIEVFWSEKTNDCYVVNRRPFFTPTSDWAIEYFGETNTKDPYFLEAETFTLVYYSKPKIVLSETYSYKNLEEYLEDPKKYIEWEADFLKKVEKFR